MSTVEERLAALEARFGIGVTPLAAVPPVTVGELVDVPAPGSPIASQWANEVSNRIVHRFPDVATMNAWAAADGSVAWVGGVAGAGNRSLYYRFGANWVPATRFDSFSVGLSLISISAAVEIGRINIPAVPYARRGFMTGIMLANYATAVLADQVQLSLQWFGAVPDNLGPLISRSIPGASAVIPPVVVQLSGGVGGSFVATGQRVGGATAVSVVDGRMSTWLWPAP